MKTEAATFEWERGAVSGVWHHPDGGDTYLVLAHGAGGTMDTPSMRAFADGIAERGLGAVRFNFGYAEEGKRAPSKAAILESCFRSVADRVAERAATVLLGGRSMGGRMGSHLAAAGYPAAGLVLLAYPLHPPGRFDRLRDAHLGEVRVPMLFLQGTNDAFARPDLLAATIGALPLATLHAIEGADHSHRVKGRPQAEVVGELVATTVDWARRIGVIA
ncbi:MAG TPA: alpha/beta family hydrolase [Actinomycetota bacterium]